MDMTSFRRAQLAIKRSIDLLVGGVLLALLLPNMALIGLLVRATSPGGAIFRQRRIGRSGRPFTILKFRTMVSGAKISPLGTSCYRDDPRITPVGRFLRRTGLDELPQLINVVRGDMSLVGPRPDLPHHVERYSPRQRLRLKMRPGMTGWAQVNGRNDITWGERIELDLDYVARWSIFMDAAIAVKTIGVIALRKGAELPRPLP
jgi:lipopolysaccharide/colanic/teichoic acid biosynthesis glycosyltransferase